MARAADQFRQSDIVKWGAVAAATAFLALVCVNVSALLPDGSLAVLHNSRAVNRQAAELNAEVVALNGSKANLLNLVAAQQQLQNFDAQLAGRLDGIEKASLSDRGRIGTLEAALPRLVNTLPINGADSSLITGSIGSSTPGFRTAESEPPALPAPQATAPTVPPAVAAPSPPASAMAVDQPAVSSGAAPASPSYAPAMPAPGPQWGSIVSLPVFATPEAAAPSADIASIAPAAPAVSDAPFPMAPRMMPSRMAGVQLAPVPVTSVATAAAPPAHPDVKAIGVAVGSPMQPAQALANWQQIAERVGIMLVGMSPLLADDPAGSPGKVLVAGPIASIAAATKLCADIDRSGLSCMPMPYVGAELSPGATQ